MVAQPSGFRQTNDRTRRNAGNPDQNQGNAAQRLWHSDWQINTDGNGFTPLKNFGFPRIGVPDRALTPGPDGRLYGTTSGLDGQETALFFSAFDPVALKWSVLYSLLPTNLDTAATGLAAPLLFAHDGFGYACVTFRKGKPKFYRFSTDGSLFKQAFIQLPEADQIWSFAQLPDDRFAVCCGTQLCTFLPNGPGWMQSEITNWPAGGYPLKGSFQLVGDAFYGCLRIQATNSYRFFKLDAGSDQFEWLSEKTVDQLGQLTYVLWGKEGFYYALSEKNNQTQLARVQAANGPVTLLAQADIGNYGSLMGNGLAQASTGDLYFHTYHYGNRRDYCFRVSPSGAQVQQIGAIAMPNDNDRTVGAWVEGPGGHLFLLKKYEGYSLAPPDQLIDVWQMNFDGSALQTVYSLNQPPAEGALPQLLFEGSDGKYYGALSIGGQFNHGLIFRMASDGSEYEPVYPFNGQSFGLLTLLEGSDGWLYGLGRQNGLNIFFKLRKDGTGYQQFALQVDNRYLLNGFVEGADRGLCSNPGTRLWAFRAPLSWKGQLLFPRAPTNPLRPMATALH